MIPLPCPLADPALEPGRALKFRAPQAAAERGATPAADGSGCAATRGKAPEESAPGQEGEFQAVLRTLAEEAPPHPEGAPSTEAARAGEAEAESSAAACLAALCWLQTSLGLAWPPGVLPGALPPEGESPALPTAQGVPAQPGQAAGAPLLPLAQLPAATDAPPMERNAPATTQALPAAPPPPDPGNALEDTAAASAQPAAPAPGLTQTPFTEATGVPAVVEAPPTPQTDVSRPARTVEPPQAGVPVEAQQDTERPSGGSGEPPGPLQAPEGQAPPPTSAPTGAAALTAHGMAAEGREQLRGAASGPQGLRRPGPSGGADPDPGLEPEGLRPAGPWGPDPAAGLVQPGAAGQGAEGPAHREAANEQERGTALADPAVPPASPTAREAGAPAEPFKAAEPREAASGRPPLTPAGFQRVVSAARMSAAGGGVQVRLTLHPESLGEVVVQVRWDRGALTAQLEAATPAARAALEGGLERLRTALAEQGIPVERLQVGLQLGAEAHSQRHARAEREAEAPAPRQAEALRPVQALGRSVADSRRLDVRV